MWTIVPLWNNIANESSRKLFISSRASVIPLFFPYNTNKYNMYLYVENIEAIFVDFDFFCLIWFSYSIIQLENMWTKMDEHKTEAKNIFVKKNQFIPSVQHKSAI